MYKIARDHGTTVAALKSANDIHDGNQIHVGQVLVVPEGATKLSGTPAHETAPETAATPRTAVRQAAGESRDVIALRRGISEQNWIVTRNPDSGKIFVHRSQSGQTLVDMQYVIEESRDGTTWTLYRAGARGRSVGVMEKPDNLDIGLCGCM